MNRHDFIRELGWAKATDVQSSDLLARIERIVRKAEAEEREACAKVCENMETHRFENYIGRDFAHAIRARGDELKRHPGYIIGDHWLQAAYTRICTGETEDEVMTDYGWQRESR